MRLLTALCLVLVLAQTVFCNHAGWRSEMSGRMASMPGLDGSFRSLLDRHAANESAGGPERIIEVSRPIVIPASAKSCTVALFDYSFADTIDAPPSTSPYGPPSPLECGSEWSLVVLDWKATSRGVQYDRIAGVWLGGVEILRTCTAEPTERGIEWSVQKDITRYSALLKQPQNISVSLGNLINSAVSGIYNVTVSAIFYVAKEGSSSTSTQFASVILPISSTPGNGSGLWFVVQNQTDSKSGTLTLPQNIYRAVLEVCLSFHGNDEFWYITPPNGSPVFREVVASIDGKVAGAVWPIVILYTGGINPNFWRPLVAIGAFNLPSYDLDVTPFTGELVDGNQHSFTLSVTNSQPMWYVGANLHLWIDEHSTQTHGAMVTYFAPPLVSSLSQNESIGVYNSTASRQISISGYVSSSLGNQTTHNTLAFTFFNAIVENSSSGEEIVDQLTLVHGNTTVVERGRKTLISTTQSRFPFSYHSESNGQIISHAYLQSEESQVGTQWSRSSIKNYQTVSQTPESIATSSQNYSYGSSTGCFCRRVRVNANFVYLHDANSTSCTGGC